MAPTGFTGQYFHAQTVHAYTPVVLAYMKHTG